MLGNSEILSIRSSESKQSEILLTRAASTTSITSTTYSLTTNAASVIQPEIATTTTSEKIKLLQQRINDAAISADQRLLLEQQKRNSHHSSPLNDSNGTPITNITGKLGYQLRALRNDISALETNHWNRPNTLPKIIHSSSLSNELVNETLNYFVNCGKRLSQMTKTYDDNDAYILLLQEKEVDLELAARIGQDLLRQNNQLKDSIKSLESELAKRQDDVQQLKYELASKVSLLDTFIEEEESKTTFYTDEDDDFKQQQQDCLQKPSTPAISTSKPSYFPSPDQTSSFLVDNNEDHHRHTTPNGFLSLDYNNHQQVKSSPSTSAEPFASLPYHLNKALIGGENSYNDDSNSLIGEEILNLKSDQNIEHQSHLVQSVTFQLVESNKRLCELQDELFCKGEQNLMQQEKLSHLQEQLRESDRRLEDISAENESLHRKILDSIENRKELYDELKVTKHNFNELLRVFLDFQRESRISRMRNMQQNSNASFFDELDPFSDTNNVSFDSFGSISYEAFMNCQNVIRSVSRNTIPTSSSLLEELQESMKNNEDNSDNSTNGDATDGGDSGVHINNNNNNNISSRVKLDKIRLNSSVINENDLPSSDDTAKDKKNWLGYSSFMLTTLLLLCLSVTMNSSAGYSLAQKLQIKWDR